MPPVMDQGVSNAKGGRSGVARAVGPVGIVVSRRRGPHMNMDVAGVAVFDQTAVKGIRALVRPDIGLRGYTEVQALEIVDPVTNPVHHGSEEPAQGIRLIPTFNLFDSGIFNGQSDRFAELGGYADIR